MIIYLNQNFCRKNFVRHTTPSRSTTNGCARTLGFLISTGGGVMILLEIEFNIKIDSFRF